MSYINSYTRTCLCINIKVNCQMTTTQANDLESSNFYSLTLYLQGYGGVIPCSFEADSWIVIEVFYLAPCGWCPPLWYADFAQRTKHTKGFKTFYKVWGHWKVFWDKIWWSCPIITRTNIFITLFKSIIKFCGT